MEGRFVYRPEGSMIGRRNRYFQGFQSYAHASLVAAANGRCVGRFAEVTELAGRLGEFGIRGLQVRQMAI